MKGEKIDKKDIEDNTVFRFSYLKVTLLTPSIKIGT